MYFNIQQQEEADYQINAAADYISEAFGDEARLLNEQACWEAKEEEDQYRNDALDAIEARGGPAPVEYIEPWTADNADDWCPF